MEDAESGELGRKADTFRDESELGLLFKMGDLGCVGCRGSEVPLGSGHGLDEASGSQPAAWTLSVLSE